MSLKAAVNELENRPSRSSNEDVTWFHRTLCALVFLTPMVWWNMHQGWVTLQHTSEHFGAGPFLAITRFLGQRRDDHHLQWVGLIAVPLGAERQLAYHIWRGVDFQEFPETRD